MASVIPDATTTSTSASFSHTTSGTNRLLLVSIAANSAPTGVTYNGVSMTAISGSPVSYNGGSQFLSVYYLINPALGSNTVSCSGGFNSGIARSYTRAYQTTQPDGVNSNTGTNSVSTTFTTGTAYDLGFLATGQNGGSTPVGTNCTLITSIGTSPTLLAIYDTGTPITSAGSYTESASSSGGIFGALGFGIRNDGQPVTMNVLDTMTMADNPVFQRVATLNVLDTFGTVDNVTSKKGWAYQAKSIGSGWTYQPKN